MAEAKDRVLPYDLNAEAAVLSAMMIDSLTVLKSIEDIKENYFYSNRHRVIFNAMVDLFSKQMEVDVITLLDYLESGGQIDKAGGKDYILQIADVVVSGANFTYHCRILKEKYLLRELILTSNRIIERCYEGGVTAGDLLDFAEQSVFQLYDTSSKKGFAKVGQYTTEVLKTIEDLATSKFGVHGVASGFLDIDDKIGGFRPGQLIVLAARPSMGKSALAVNIGFNVARNTDTGVGIFTMEMSAEEVLMRMLSSASDVPLDNMLKGHGMDQYKIRAITECAESISTREIFIDDSGTNTPLELRAKVRRLKAEQKNLGLIIIDYLQLLSTSKRIENRQQEMSEISRNLKILAKEMDVPVIALSQLNRELEKRDDKKPRLSDLRESGAIEQDADIVMFIYREEVYADMDKKRSKGKEDDDFADFNVRKNVADIIIAKNRHGAIGTVSLRFEPETTSFDNLAKPQRLSN